MALTSGLAQILAGVRQYRQPLDVVGWCRWTTGTISSVILCPYGSSRGLRYQYCRIQLFLGLQALRVIEDSVMPSMPSVNTYSATMVIAEKSSDVIEIDDHRIRIKGGKDVLERAILAELAASESGSQMSTGWRARQDSNL
jgi:hypothetical protein